MEEDRRKHKRLETHKTDIKFKFKGDETEYKAGLLDVSGGGTRLEIELESEQRIELSVFKPLVFDLEFENKTIECKGQVVRAFIKEVDNRTCYDFGIIFKDMPEEDIKFIKNYIHTKAED